MGVNILWCVKYNSHVIISNFSWGNFIICVYIHLEASFKNKFVVIIENFSRFVLFLLSEISLWLHRNVTLVELPRNSMLLRKIRAWLVFRAFDLKRKKVRLLAWTRLRIPSTQSGQVLIQQRRAARERGRRKVEEMICLGMPTGRGEGTNLL